MSSIESIHTSNNVYIFFFVKKPLLAFNWRQLGVIFSRKESTISVDLLRADSSRRVV
jgi:hypothetical protein